MVVFLLADVRVVEFGTKTLMEAGDTCRQSCVLVVVGWVTDTSDFIHALRRRWDRKYIALCH